MLFQPNRALYGQILTKNHILPIASKYIKYIFYDLTTIINLKLKVTKGHLKISKSSFSTTYYLFNAQYFD